jgi:hypothetical protein
VLSNGAPGQLPQQCEKLLSPRQVAASKLPDDERVAEHFGGLEPGHKARVAAPQVVHPDRGIDEDHHTVRA